MTVNKRLEVDMSNNYLFLPLVVQVALTLGLYIYLGLVKSRATQQGMVDESRRALHDDAWPDSVMQVNNCIRNQFEVPVLFYVLTFVLWSINSVNIFIHAAAWLFVFSRIVHALIHTRSNYVPLRRKIFTLGCLILMGMTAFTAIKILSV